MTTCANIINLSLQITKVYGADGEANSYDAALGLVALQSMYDQMVADGVFGRLTDAYKTGTYTAAENERVVSPSAITVTFPTYVDDTDNGGSRSIRDLACIETILNGVRVVKIWDRTGWVSLLGLGADDDAPLASRGALGLAAYFAVSGAFATVFGTMADVGPNILQLANQFKWSVCAKMGSTQDKAMAEYF